MFETKQLEVNLYSNQPKKLIPIHFISSFDKTNFYSNYASYNSYSAMSYNTYPLVTDSLNRIVSKELSDESTLETFNFIRRSTIKSFFNSQLVDVPICFKKSKSLYTPTFEIPLIKFSNILMRSGLRGQVIRNVTKSFAHFFHNLIPGLTPEGSLKWVQVHHLIDNLLLAGNFHLLGGGAQLVENALLSAGNKFDDFRINFNYKASLDHLLFETLKKNSPIFNFSIRKVDKSIRKNSRGKSGKYTIIWKYIPTYKRLYVTIRWLLKELKFQRVQTFEGRLIQMLQTFLLEPNTSFVVRLRKFVHGFVFYNYKNTLLKNLRSTS